MMKLFKPGALLLTLCLVSGFAAAAPCSRLCRRHQRLSPGPRNGGGEVDGKLNAVALKQAQAMAATGSVSHSAAGSFSSRAVPLRKSRAAENIGAGFLTFAEMLKEWENSSGHRENLLVSGARRVGVAFVDNQMSPYRKFWAMVITD
jgi:Cysteine-rich secretory protein family